MPLVLETQFIYTVRAMLLIKKMSLCSEPLK